MPVDAPLLLQGGVFFTLLLAASVTDIKKRIIPDSVCIAIALTGLIGFQPVQFLGLLTALPFLLAAVLCGGMGGGDIKLMAAAGIVLGMGGGIAATVIGLTAMLLFYAVYKAITKARGRECSKAFPLAPFLSIGCVAAYILQIGGFIS